MSAAAGWNVTVSDTAKNTFNRIRAIVDGMVITPNPEKDMIPLSIGDPTVFGNLSPPEVAVKSIIEAAKSGKYNGYSPSAGYEESRAAVARYLSKKGDITNPEDVFLTSGCSSALEHAISVLVNPGDNILIPRPGFSLYQTLCESHGLEVKSYNCLPDRMWEVDLSHLQSLIDKRTKAIVVVNPSNPCGSNFTREHVREIVQVALRHKIPIIADEIYGGMAFKPLEFTSCSSQSENVPVVTCGGISKIFLVPGWRLGWVVVHDRNDIFGQKIRDGLMRLTQRILGACTLVQAILPRLLEDEDTQYMDKAVFLIQSNAEYAFGRISNMCGLKPITPQAAFYMMVGISMKNFPDFKDEKEFTEAMVSEQSVFCLPASNMIPITKQLSKLTMSLENSCPHVLTQHRSLMCFNYPDFFRIVLTVPEEKMREACDRMEEFCKKHYVP